MTVVLLAGTAAGLLLFAVQHFTTFPLIERAETFESRAEASMPGMHHEASAWQPSDSIERTCFTALTTVLSAIGFAALLFGTASLGSLSLDWRKGLLLGLAAFVCVGLAPAWGLPPQPPGAAVADIYARQFWWVATVVSTAVALWLLLDRRRPWPVRLSGLVIFLLPHVIGAPVALGESSVPMDLIHQFALASILTSGMFWIALGSIGGLLYGRKPYAAAQ
jgi:cobalt transporter subunit CbtA